MSMKATAVLAFCFWCLWMAVMMMATHCKAKGGRAPSPTPTAIVAATPTPVATGAPCKRRLLVGGPNPWECYRDGRLTPCPADLSGVPECR